jgi:hypothetical protein
VLSTAVFMWMQVRVILVGNLLFMATILTCIIIYGFELSKDYTTLSMTMTYSILGLSAFDSLMFFLCGAE